MFSNLLESKYSDEDNISTIILSYNEITQLSPVHYKYHYIHTLTINHCQLSLLTHIDQFEELESLNVKYNNITNVKEIMKIKNKHKIKSLNFKGNDIEHYLAARIDKLKVDFPNLIELNGVDYRFMEVAKLGAQKPVENVRILHRLDTLGMILDSMNKSVGEEKQNAKKMTSRKKQMPQKEYEDEPTERRKQLQISTGHLENMNHQPSQPTATFAKQKEMEQKSVFGFKKQMGLSRIDRKSQHSFNMDMCSVRYASNNINNSNKGLFPELNEQVGEQADDLTVAFYNQGLLKKILWKWRQLSHNYHDVKEDRPFKKQWPAALKQ